MSYRLAHQSQLERKQTSPNLRLGLAFLLLEWKPTPAHHPACPRQGHTDSFPFQTGKPPPGIAGRRQPATLPGLAFGPSLWFKGATPSGGCGPGGVWLEVQHSW